LRDHCTRRGEAVKAKPRRVGAEKRGGLTVPAFFACYPRAAVSTFDRLADLAPERVRPLKRVEYARLVEAGVFEEERVELLGGAIVEMSPHGTPHDSAVMRLTKLLVRAVGDRAEVRVQLAFVASDQSQPEPDLALVPPGDYREAHPDTAMLLVEVSAESLRKDRTLKAAIYARAGVPEYWIVNVVDGSVERHTNPQSGAYTEMMIVRPGASIRLRILDDVEIPVAEIFR
jgi:Uma2 family endonuclease